MAARSYGRFGFARFYALVFGIAYIAVALLEVLLGDDGLILGEGGGTNSLILLFEPIHNAIHWLTGIAVLGSFFAGENAARNVAKVVGIVFTIVFLLGLFAGKFTMDLLGYEGAPSVPISYQIIHFVTAAGALFAGFARSAPRTATA